MTWAVLPFLRSHSISEPPSDLFPACSASRTGLIDLRWMANDTIFMRSAVNERTLLETLERITGLVCCSLEFPKDSAQAVLVPIEYSEGFRFAPSLTWHASLHLAVSFDEIVAGEGVRRRRSVPGAGLDFRYRAGEVAARIAHGRLTARGPNRATLGRHLLSDGYLDSLSRRGVKITPPSPSLMLSEVSGSPARTILQKDCKPSDCPINI